MIPARHTTATEVQLRQASHLGEGDGMMKMYIYVFGQALEGVMISTTLLVSM